MCKFPAIVLIVAFFAITPLCADSSCFPALANTPGDLEPWSTFSGDELAFAQTDYLVANATANLFPKNDGHSGLGLALASAINRQIGGTYTILLDLRDISDTHTSSVVFSNLPGEDVYPIGGPIKTGNIAALLASNQASTGLGLTDGGPYSLSILPSPGSGTGLLDGLTVTNPSIGTPEPNSALLLVLGLGALAGIAAFAKK